MLVCLAAALGLFYVARPLFTAASPRTDSAQSDAMLRKLRALEAILDLESDLAAGKLSLDDYDSFKEIYEHDALAALRELDIAAQGVRDTDLEAEIAAARAELR